MELKKIRQNADNRDVGYEISRGKGRCCCTTTVRRRAAPPLGGAVRAVLATPPPRDVRAGMWRNRGCHRRRSHHVRADRATAAGGGVVVLGPGCAAAAAPSPVRATAAAPVRPQFGGASQREVRHGDCIHVLPPCSHPRRPPLREIQTRDEERSAFGDTRRRGREGAARGVGIARGGEIEEPGQRDSRAMGGRGVSDEGLMQTTWAVG